MTATPFFTSMKSKNKNISKLTHLFCVALFFICCSNDKAVSISDLWINQSTASITVGDILPLSVFFFPENAANKNVRWKSDHPQIASVTDDGLVTGEAAGTALITVTAQENDKFSTCTVTVNDVAIPVTDVTVSHSDERLHVGETLTLTANIYPDNATNQAVEWKSDNIAVAQVDDGLVTAISVGEAIITVTTRDRNRTATCAVTVFDDTPKIVDKNATKETKALLANLLAIQNVGAMFGHHDDLMYGREWYNEAGRSDVKEVCGDYPAVYSLDFSSIMDNTYLNEQEANAIRRRCIIEAYARGEIIMACIHTTNPLTGGNAWDNSNNTVVREILKNGSVVSNRYKQWLDRLADFANNLKDPSGTLIPVLFRPYHEHTQEWSWWGSKCTTEDEFIGLWRYTIEYLRDTKGVHNFLYAISPQMDANYGNPGTRQRLLYRWPGDEWVDFLGMDCYHGTWTQAYQTNLNTIVDIAKEKGIPCGVAETGIEGIQVGGNDIIDYWTVQQLAPLKQLKQNKGSTVSMVVMWRNEYSSNPANYHFFGPWIKHPSAPDFVKFYEDPNIIFSKDLPDMYQ